MNEEQDKWEKLINLPESYEPDPSLADKAIEKINQKESTVKFKKHNTLWMGIAACFLVCCIGLAVFLPVYFSGRTVEEIYYSEEALESVKINDVNEFVKENQLKIRYFSNDGTVTRGVKVVENNKWAYLVQDTFDVGEAGYYIINLQVVMLKNATFDFNRDFDSLDLSTTVSNIAVNYSLTEDIDGNIYKIKFMYESNAYYLTITTADGSSNVVEKYVNRLLA